MTELVYVVACGEYDDYRVVCVAPTQVDAEAIVKKLRRNRRFDDPRVETLPVFDRTVKKQRVHQFTVNIWDNGTQSDEYEVVESVWPFNSWQYTGRLHWRWVRAPYHDQLGGGGRLDVQGTDGELCAKVFGEKRAQLVADPVLARKTEWAGTQE